MSNFFGLTIARNSLYASQKAMEVTSHNIANVNTEGYSRQVVNFEADISNSGLIYDKKNASNLGSGVIIQNVEQIRYEYYDRVYRREAAISSELTAKSEAYTYIEEIMNSNGSSSISSMVTNLYNSMEELSLDSDNLILREQVKQNTILLTGNLNSTTQSLYNFQRELNENIASITGDVNKTADEIATLNEMIFSYELHGNMANDLRDQRNLLVDQLSQQIGAKATEDAAGNYRVSVGGFAIVDHVSVSHITLQSDMTNPVTGEEYSTLYWGSTNTKVTLTNGEIKAKLDIRDGTSADSSGINYLTNRLDNLAGSLVTEFNLINNAGYTRPYGANASQTGIDFFDPANVNALNISISDALTQDASNIAASSEMISGTSNWSNNENLQGFLDLREVDSITYGSENIGDFESYIENTYTQLAFATGFATTREASQDSVVSHLINQRDSISGVNLDEEMLNLSKYQKSYQAAAKLINVIDEMMQTLLSI